MFARHWPGQADGEVDKPITVRVTGAGPVTLTATDAWGTVMDWRHELALDGGAGDLPFTAAHGVYRIEARDESGSVVAQTYAGITGC